MSAQIKIVLPDTGPLITLAHADALDVLLVFEPDQVQLVLTDMVEFESTRLRSTRMDAQRIADFIVKHAGRIVIEQTSLGQMAIAAAQTYDRYSNSTQVREFYAANNMPIPRPAPANTGELSINSYVTGLIGQPPGPPCLVVAEDDFFLRSTPGALPGNAHIISTFALLSEIERLDPGVKAREILESARLFQDREPNRANVDKPAPKIPKGSSWKSTLNAKNLTDKLTKRAGAGKA